MVGASIVLGLLGFVVLFLFAMLAAAAQPLILLSIPVFAWLFVKWALVWPAIVAERAGPLQRHQPLVEADARTTGGAASRSCSC